MGNLDNFDSSTTEPFSTDFEPLPPGLYSTKIVESEVKNTLAGNGGKYLKLRFEVLGGEFQNRILFINLNIKNPNPKAQKIGLGQLSALCRAVGKIGIVDDSSALHDIPLVVKVDIEEGSGDYRDKNVIKAFYPAKDKAIETASPKLPSSFESDEIPF